MPLPRVAKGQATLFTLMFGPPCRDTQVGNISSTKVFQRLLQVHIDVRIDCYFPHFETTKEKNYIFLKKPRVLGNNDRVQSIM